MRSPSLIAFVLAGVVGASTLSASEPATVGPDLQVRELRPGVWLHVSKDANGAPANGIIVSTGDGLLLADTTWTEGQAERLMAWAEKTTGAPLARAIVTHSHADRAGGVAALHRKRVPVVALDLTVTKLATRAGRCPTS